MRYAPLALLVSCLLVSGCGPFAESCFDLSPESRLPRWFSLPAGTPREAASVHMCYYIDGNGRSATFVLRGKQNKKLAEVSGLEQGHYPLGIKDPPSGYPQGYPTYEIVSVNGIADVIEHRRMEPIFFINDDPSVWAELGVSR
jgi:hypothetical protein